MDDMKIYQYLARKPDARAQDIADTLNAELKDASDTLRDLVEVGTIVRHAGTGPNGLPCQLYNLSDVFKRSRDGVAVLAAAAGMVDAAPAFAPAAPAQAPVTTPVFAQQTELQPAKTRVDRGLAHLALHKTATDDDMRTAMGLKGRDAPRAYMVSAIKSGKVVKDENGWRLGDGTPPGKPKPGAASRNFSVTNPKGGPVAQFGKQAYPVDRVTNDDVKDLPAAVVEQLSKPAQVKVQEQLGRIAGGLPDKIDTQPPAAPLPTGLRFGLWSDGILDIQRDGKIVDSLTSVERKQLAKFMTAATTLMMSTT